MNPSSFISRLLFHARKTFITGARVLTSRERFKAFYRVSLYRNATYLILNTAATGILGFVFWILAARFYPAEEVGLASAVIAVAAFLTTLATLGMDFGLVRYISGAGKNYAVLVNSCLTAGGLVAIVASLVFLAGLKTWSPDLVFLRQDILPLVIFIVLVVTWTLYTLLHNVFVAQQRADVTLWQSIAQGLIRIVLVVTLPASLYASGIITAYGAAFVIAVIVSMLILLPWLRKGYRPSLVIKKEVITQIARFSSANFVAGLVTKVPTVVLPLMVIGLLGAEQNAYFYMAYGVISNAVFLIPAGISLSLFAEGSKDEAKLGDYVKKSLKFSFLILVPLIILVFLVGDKILLLFGKAYSAEATRLLQVLALSALPGTVNAIYFYKKRVEKKMKIVISLTVLSVIIIVGLSYYLLPTMGIMGAGIARLAGSVLVTLIILGESLMRRMQNQDGLSGQEK